MWVLRDNFIIFYKNIDAAVPVFKSTLFYPILHPQLLLYKSMKGLDHKKMSQAKMNEDK